MSNVRDRMKPGWRFAHCPATGATMSKAGLAPLGKLIAVHHGWPAAKDFKAYRMDNAARAKISATALDILKVFPPIPGAGALMSAAFAVRLEEILSGPIHIVAGTLSVNGELVLGDRSAVLPGAFGHAHLDWDGHVWAMVGPYIADVSIFRTAYSRSGPAALSRHIDLVFGPNKGLYVDHWGRTRQLGLIYEPGYVLSRDEVNGLMGAAYQKIQHHAAQARSNAGG